MEENFGSYLKHERELRGVPLEEIAAVTKVHIRFLEALENSEFDQLPGEVFIKGYIRSYARVIGLDSEEMVTAYEENFGKVRKQELENAHLASEKIHSRKKNLAGYVIGGIGLAGILMMGYLGVGSLVEEGNKQGAEQLSANAPALNAVEPEIPKDVDVSNEEQPEQELAAGLSQEVPPALPVDSRAESEVNKNKPVAADSKLKEKPSPYVAEVPMEADSNSEAVEANTKPLHLMIQVQGNSWFNVTVDDGGEDDFILPGGSSKNIYGNEKFRVTIGNRRGTRIFLNGQSIDLPFGTSNVVRDFDITAKLIE
jgi:cytoskeleton protein RodZ